MSATFDYLTEQDRERLKGLPFPVALPNELPAGWQAKPLVIDADTYEGEVQDVSCEVSFAGPDSAAFTVMTTNGGIGDALVEDDAPLRIPNSEFGTVVVLASEDPEDPEIQSDWFPEDEGAPFYHCVQGEGVSDSDLKALVESLGLFTP